MTTEARYASDADDGFHEIQLNGKQLVFLGMTTTIVSVVIFLCGVLVGRGVRPLEPVAEAASVVAAVADPAPQPAPTTPDPQPVAEAVPPASQPTPAPAPDATPAPPAAAAATPSPGPPTPPAASAASKPATDTRAPVATTAAAAPPPAKSAAPKPQEPKPVESKPVEPRQAEARTPPPVAEPAPDADPVPASAPVASDAPVPAASSGAIAVQVAALSSRTDAEAIARRLSGKGYAAYVLETGAGGKSVYKVRVGNYASADEAERVKRRLAQEEKLKPWVTR